MHVVFIIGECLVLFPVGIISASKMEALGRRATSLCLRILMSALRSREAGINAVCSAMAMRKDDPETSCQSSISFCRDVLLKSQAAVCGLSPKRVGEICADLGKCSHLLIAIW